MHVAARIAAIMHIDYRILCVAEIVYRSYSVAVPIRVCVGFELGR